METEPTGRRLTRSAGMQASQPSAEQLKAITRWVAILADHHRKEISELGMVGYIEGLSDLRPEQIDTACARALREVERMPSAADIRKCLYDSTPTGNRPEYLDEAPLSEEQRAEALKFSDKLKETILKMDEKVRKAKIPAALPQSAFAAAGLKSEQDYQIYVQWLIEQTEKDEMDRKTGMSPLPRSKEERLAMFYMLPQSERRRLKKKAEWAKR